ncbi:MAG: DUF488 domain-containing protein, partial [Acidobacteriota bacterium]|nr:DUF488 domain-containing protein [Acidobacteriota bacterium]
VRSQPYSRYNPQFNKENVARSLQAAGLAYVFLGRELGARVDDPSCIEDGRVSYPKVARTELFRSGLERLRSGMRTHRIALMCVERDPLTCHRMMLVTRNLRDDAIDIRHIRADGSIETNAAAERRMLEMLRMPRESLFQDEKEMIEEAYIRLGRRIAHAPREQDEDPPETRSRGRHNPLR